VGGVILAGFLTLGGMVGWKYYAFRSHYAALESIQTTLRAIGEEPPNGIPPANWRAALGLVFTAEANFLLPRVAKTADVKALAVTVQQEPFRSQLHTPKGLFQMLSRIKSISQVDEDRLDSYRFSLRSYLGAEDPNVPSKWEKL
jgi:hypothetical protein